MRLIICFASLLFSLASYGRCQAARGPSHPVARDAPLSGNEGNFELESPEHQYCEDTTYVWCLSEFCCEGEAGCLWADPGLWTSLRCLWKRLMIEVRTEQSLEHTGAEGWTVRCSVAREPVGALTAELEARLLLQLLPSLFAVFLLEYEKYAGNEVFIYL